LPMRLTTFVFATDLLWITTTVAQAAVMEPGALKDTLPAALKSCAERMISVFENESTSLKYNYVEDLNDGRGFTAGRAGFVTRDGDLLQVVELYNRVRPRNALSGFLPMLRTVLGRQRKVWRVCRPRGGRPLRIRCFARRKIKSTTGYTMPPRCRPRTISTCNRRSRSSLCMTPVSSTGPETIWIVWVQLSARLSPFEGDPIKRERGSGSPLFCKPEKRFCSTPQIHRLARRGRSPSAG